MSVSKREFTKRAISLIFITISGCASDPYGQKKTTYDHPYRLRVINYSNDDLTLNILAALVRDISTEKPIKEGYSVEPKQTVYLDSIVNNNQEVKITVQIVNGIVESFTIAPHERVILEIMSKNEVKINKITK